MLFALGFGFLITLMCHSNGDFNTNIGATCAGKSGVIIGEFSIKLLGTGPSGWIFRYLNISLSGLDLRFLTI